MRSTSSKSFVYSWDLSIVASNKMHIPDCFWPVMYLLSGFSKNYVFVNVTLASACAVSGVFNTWINTIRWREVFKDKSVSNLWMHLRFCLSTLPCKYLASFAFASALSMSVGYVLGAVRSMRRANRTCLFPFDAFANLGFRTLRAADWLTLPSDKDGGFVLFLQSRLEEYMHTYLSPPTYMTSKLSFDVLQATNKINVDICYRVAEFEEDQRLANILLPDSRRTRGDLVATLQSIVNTHKLDGYCVPRLIHSCHRHPFKPLCCYIASVFRRRLDPLEQLIRDSADLACKSGSAQCQ